MSLTQPDLNTALTQQVGGLLGGGYRYVPITFTGVPASPVQGQVFFITDSNTATLGGTVSASGASAAGLVIWNGSAWTLVSK
jgi:hypothetical protein